MCRLAVLFRRPVREIAAWPAWEVRLLEEFLAREPAGIDRLEIIAARFAAQYFNFHSAPDSPKFETVDFLPFYRPFAQPDIDLSDERYSDVDRSFLSVLK